jgi:6-pyruvoyl-tetrahydropterin synthase
MSKKQAPEASPADPRELILRMLQVKSGMKQDVYHRTIALFGQLKEVVQEVADDLEHEMIQRDKRVNVQYRDKGEAACELKVAGDTIIFHMHTNVFKLDQSNSLWKTSYLEEDELRGYFGVINIYNFLSDSFKYNRERDLGYLVSRLFLNKEGHFFVQGKRQLGFLYNDLPGNVMDRSVLKQVVYSVIMYVLDFDLLTPPYDQVNQVTVMEMNELNAGTQISTGKRLGFRFQADVDDLT